MVHSVAYNCVAVSPKKLVDTETQWIEDQTRDPRVLGSIPTARVLDIGGSGGRQGRAPPRSKFFHFHAVFGKKFAK